MESDEFPGLAPNVEEHTCSNCGEVYDYRNFTTTGSIDVAGLSIKRICPSIDCGFVMHLRE